jgi:glucose-6-phosphate dehydrogenase assembly protein OpcA
MSMEEFAAGKSIPVALKDVEKSIPAMWRKLAEAAKEKGAKTAVTRACLWNLIVRTSGGKAFDEAKQLIDTISNSVPARVLVLDAQPAAPTAPIQSWIEANWHSGGGGAHQIGSEELTFKASGETVADLASIVRALLIGDVPVAALWHGLAPGGDALDHDMLSAATRVVIGVDGAEETMRAVSSLLEGGRLRPGTGLTSLAWLRSSHWRQLVASLFDPPSEAGAVEKISEVRVVCGADHVNAALLLIGWFAARLGWKEGKAVDRAAHSYAFTGAGGAVKAGIDVGGTSEDIFTRVEVTTPDGRSSISRIGPSVILETPVTARKQPRHIPGDAELWLAALGARGHDPLFVEALRRAAPLVR